VVSNGTNGLKGANATCSWTPWGWWVARRVEAANVSDRRVGARLLAGFQSGFQSIRTVMVAFVRSQIGWLLRITFKDAD
jgi:hypothetical protein